MITLSALFFIAKRMPRMIVLLLTFINIFLLVFLLVGCYSSSHINTYLSRFTFASDSTLYPMIKQSFTHNAKTTGFENVVVKVGYLRTCIDKVPRVYNMDNNSIATKCYSGKTIENESIYSDITLQLFNVPKSSQSSNTTTSTPVTLNLLELAHITAAKVVHPHLLIATVAFTVLEFIGMTYYLIPLLPFKNWINIYNIVLASLLLLLWTIGVMWEHVATRATAKLIPPASLGIIKSHRGRKAASMAWLIFSFQLINTILLWFLCIRDRKSEVSDLDLDLNYNFSTNSSMTEKT